MSKNRHFTAIRGILHCNVLNQIILLLILIAMLISCSCIKNEAADIEFEKDETSKIAVINTEDISYYWNRDWLGRPTALYDEIRLTTTTYIQTHNYIFGENDCNDMAVELWQILKDKGVTSLIAIGNLEKSNESFFECNHAWLLVYSGEGSAAAVDTVSAGVYLWEQVASNPQLKQFWEGFLYENPTNLFTDFKDRW